MNLKLAKELYLKNKKLSDICLKADMSMSTLKNYTRKWSVEKETQELDVVKQLLPVSKKELLENIANNGLLALNNMLKKVVSGEADLGSQGITQISNVIKMLAQISKAPIEQTKEEPLPVKAIDPLEE